LHHSDFDQHKTDADADKVRDAASRWSSDPNWCLAQRLSGSTMVKATSITVANMTIRRTSKPVTPIMAAVPASWADG